MVSQSVYPEVRSPSLNTAVAVIYECPFKNTAENRPPDLIIRRLSSSYLPYCWSDCLFYIEFTCTLPTAVTVGIPASTVHHLSVTLFSAFTFLPSGQLPGHPWRVLHQKSILLLGDIPKVAHQTHIHLDFQERLPHPSYYPGFLSWKTSSRLYCWKDSSPGILYSTHRFLMIWYTSASPYTRLCSTETAMPNDYRHGRTHPTW